MTTWLPRWFALLVLVLPFVPVVAAPDDGEIARLVKQLGDDDFDKREEASKRLAEIGQPALDALDKAATSNDAEVQHRAERILAVIETRLYGAELTLIGHTHPVWCVCVSADGKRVLTSSDDKTLRLWDAGTGKQLRVFEGHTDCVRAAALSADGKRVLSGSCDHTVRLWDATAGKELRKMTDTDMVWSVAFGPEGQALSGGIDQTMKLWDLNTGKNASVFTGHTVKVRLVAYSNQAKLAATSNHETSIRLWNLETGKEVRKLTGHTEDIQSIGFSPDGKRLLSASIDGTLRIWDVASGKELKQIKGHDPHPRWAEFSPDGKRLISGGFHDSTMRVWDVEASTELRKYQGHTASVTHVAFFPDGKRIVSASLDGTARIWRAPR